MAITAITLQGGAKVLELLAVGALVYLILNDRASSKKPPPPPGTETYSTHEKQPQSQYYNQPRSATINRSNDSYFDENYPDRINWEPETVDDLYREPDQDWDDGLDPSGYDGDFNGLW